MMPLESYYDHEGETMNKIDKIEEIRKYLRDHSAFVKDVDDLVLYQSLLKILDLLEGEVLIKDITDIPMWSSKAKIDYLGKK